MIIVIPTGIKVFEINTLVQKGTKVSRASGSRVPHRCVIVYTDLDDLAASLAIIGIIGVTRCRLVPSRCSLEFSKASSSELSLSLSLRVTWRIVSSSFASLFFSMGTLRAERVAEKGSVGIPTNQDRFLVIFLRD